MHLCSKVTGNCRQPLSFGCFSLVGPHQCSVHVAKQLFWRAPPPCGWVYFGISCCIVHRLNPGVWMLLPGSCLSSFLSQPLLLGEFSKQARTVLLTSKLWVVWWWHGLSTNPTTVLLPLACRLREWSTSSQWRRFLGNRTTSPLPQAPVPVYLKRKYSIQKFIDDMFDLIYTLYPRKEILHETSRNTCEPITNTRNMVE